jgi:hypothetical protein
MYCASEADMITSRNHHRALLSRSSIKESKMMPRRDVLYPHFLRTVCALLVLAVCLQVQGAFAQPPAGAGSGRQQLPESPPPKTEPAGAVGTTSKFIGYMTNRSIVFPDIATSPGPLGTAGKFKIFINQSISPAYILAAASSAAVDQARNVPAAWGQGWGAYGNRFGADMARASSNSFFATFLFACIFHQDPRFFPQNDPAFWGGVKYSAERLLIIRNDAGYNVVNSSGLLGPFAAEGLANAYLPASEQTAGKSLERVGTDFAWRFAGNMFKNYWPKVFRDMGLNRLKVLPDPANSH